MSNCCGIYIHVPFCTRKCFYCDFYSVPVKDESIPAEYGAAIAREIEREAFHWQDKVFTSLYLGGGTPSLLSGFQISEWLKSLTGKINLTTGAEVTLEANPANLTRDKIKSYQDSGVNRISLGVQSFADPDLAILGRLHRQHHIYAAISDLAAESFLNFNIDLIYGIPGQTMAGWILNLQKAADCRPTHISLYLLQLDPATSLGKKAMAGEVILLDEELERAMYYESLNFLERFGYKQYELSNWALPGNESRHNLVYWNGNNYWGLGAGAVSFNNNCRYINKPDYTSYCQDSIPAREILETMTASEVIDDAVILGLRLCSGINISDFRQKFGTDILTSYPAVIAKHVKQDLLEIQNNSIRLTKRGYFTSNQVFCDFIK